jgi:LSD1 subclass zinc finger protein
MPVLLLVLLLGTLLFMWLSRRNSTLTRACRWRLDRTRGANHYRCAACNAVMDTAPGKQPRDCLRPPKPPKP